MIIRHRQKILSPIQGKAVHIGGPVCSGAPRKRSIGSQKALQCCVKTAHSPLPLVVLVGWLGAQQRHLRKWETCLYWQRLSESQRCHSSLWEAFKEQTQVLSLAIDRYTHLWQSLGHPTVAVQPSTSSIVLPMLGDRQTAAFLSMLEHQRQAHLGRNLLLHIFRWDLAGSCDYLLTWKRKRHIGPSCQLLSAESIQNDLLSFHEVLEHGGSCSLHLNIETQGKQEPR